MGARIITYYASDVDTVVEILRTKLDIDPHNSVDKRRTLGARAFGYSSVPLIAKAKERYLTTPPYFSLSGLVFEIQIRSILEHAWAEIEHEIVMKSGVLYPDSVIRRFSAIAGALEILGEGFLSLKGEKNKLVEYYRVRYTEGFDLP